MPCLPGRAHHVHGLSEPPASHGLLRGPETTAGTVYVELADGGLYTVSLDTIRNGILPGIEKSKSGGSEDG